MADQLYARQQRCRRVLIFRAALFYSMCRNCWGNSRYPQHREYVHTSAPACAASCAISLSSEYGTFGADWHTTARRLPAMACDGVPKADALQAVDVESDMRARSVTSQLKLCYCDRTAGECTPPFLYLVAGHYCRTSTVTETGCEMVCKPTLAACQRDAALASIANGINMHTPRDSVDVSAKCRHNDQSLEVSCSHVRSAT